MQKVAANEINEQTEASQVPTTAAELLEWILAHAKDLHLEVEAVHYHKILQDLAAPTVRIKIHGQGFSGHGVGTDSDPDLALVKGFTEAYERALMQELRLANPNINSNGFAAHYDHTQASQNAINELIERDAFFVSYLTKRSFAMFQLEKADFCVEKYKNLQSALSTNRIDIHWFHLWESDLLHGVVCTINGDQFSNPFGLVIGASAKSTPHRALAAATDEACRQLNWVLKRQSNLLPNSLLDIEQFKSIQKPNFHDHFLLALNSIYFHKIRFLTTSKVEQNNFKRLTSESINTSYVKPMSDLLKKVPLVCYSATSLAAQNLWTGPTTAEKINLPRIAAATGLMNLKYENLNHWPHPFN